MGFLVLFGQYTVYIVSVFVCLSVLCAHLHMTLVLYLQVCV